ncbi:MAG: MATE family efflux transporter [Deltaproteobacteria bacterium]|nr:MATE family efflux transporter [Deltaproteobacteria bacterium]
MTLASTAFVAQVGRDELAGVGLGGVFAFALVCFGIGLLRGAKTLVSQAIGAGRHDRLDALLGAALGLAVGFGAFAALVGHVLAPFLVEISASPRAGGFAAQYLMIRSLGAVPLLILVALREARYGQGDTTGPMRATLAANGVNIALDALLILGLDWGVRGAAVAALCGNAVELAMIAWPMRAALRRVRWERSAVRAVWQQGLPNGLQFLMEVGSFLFLTAIIARMSATDGAAHQIVLHLINVSFLPAHALAEAASVLVGQAVGAGRFELVPRVAWRALAAGGGYALVCVVAFASTGGLIAGAFAGDDAALAAAATTLVHVSLLFLVADAANVIARGVLRGASDVRYAAFVGILTSWCTTPPVAWLLGIHLGMGAAGGWLGLAGEIIVGASLFWLRVWSGKWRSAADLARRNMVSARRDAPQVDVTTEVAPVELDDEDDEDDDASIEAVA